MTATVAEMIEIQQQRADFLELLYEVYRRDLPEDPDHDRYTGLFQGFCQRMQVNPRYLQLGLGPFHLLSTDMKIAVTRRIMEEMNLDGPN